MFGCATQVCTDHPERLPHAEASQGIYADPFYYLPENLCFVFVSEESSSAMQVCADDSEHLAHAEAPQGLSEAAQGCSQHPGPSKGQAGS